MQIDLEQMLTKMKNSQWALADIDWDAPGADLITAEQWPKLKSFMADLMWICPGSLKLLMTGYVRNIQHGLK